MTTGREAAGRAWGLSLFALLSTLSATAQVEPRDSIRLRTSAGDEGLHRRGDGLTSRLLDWGTLTVLVVPDSDDGVMVFVTPRGSTLCLGRSVTLDPNQIQAWTEAVRASLASGSTADTTPLPIEGARNSGPLVFRPEPPGSPQRYTLDLSGGCAKQEPLRVRALVENVRQFADALDYASRRSALGDEAPEIREEAGDCDLDPGGEPRMRLPPHLTHPLADRLGCTDGTVLLQYVIDTTGRADMNRVRVLYSTDLAFTWEVLSGLRLAMYRPGSRGGQLVRTRVLQRFYFKCR